MISKARSEFFTFLLAVQFLTRVPVPVTDAYSPERESASARHYPLVGIFVGIVAATTFSGAQLIFSPFIAVILSTAAVLLLTGAFHEDGLADTFDGMGGGVTAERSLEIMRDSRIGTYGTVALITVLAIKVASLSAMGPLAVFVSLIAGHALSRWSSVIVIATSNYVREAGPGKPTAEGIGTGSLVFASLTAFFCIALVGYLLTPLSAVGAAAGLITGHASMRLVFERKIGGYTGDCLGATQQASEIGMYLGVLACQ